MLVLCVCLFGRDWDTVAPPGVFFSKKMSHSPGFRVGHEHEQMAELGGVAHG